MRRQECAITDTAQIKHLLNACKVMHLGLSDGKAPYVVPLNYGWKRAEDGGYTLYFHSAHTGKKLDWIRRNPHVFFEADTAHALIAAEKACGYSFAYQSVMGEGTAEIVNDVDEKAEGLRLLMLCQTGKTFAFTQAETEAVTLVRIAVSTLTAKQDGTTARKKP